MRALSVLGAAFSLMAAQLAHACPALLDHRFTSLQGKTVNLCDYANQPILVVNTASKCGYTAQFDKLEALHKQYGKTVYGFRSAVEPDAPEFLTRVHALLKQQAAPKQ